MTRALALAALLAGLITATPALAQPAVPNIHPFAQQQPSGGWIPWDPSFNQPHYGLDKARRLGR